VMGLRPIIALSAININDFFMTHLRGM